MSAGPSFQLDEALQRLSGHDSTLSEGPCNSPQADDTQRAALDRNEDSAASVREDKYFCDEDAANSVYSDGSNILLTTWATPLMGDSIGHRTESGCTPVHTPVDQWHTPVSQNSSVMAVELHDARAGHYPPCLH